MPRSRVLKLAGLEGLTACGQHVAKPELGKLRADKGRAEGLALGFSDAIGTASKNMNAAMYHPK